jgi:hypothetical protein
MYFGAATIMSLMTAATLLSNTPYGVTGGQYVI